MKGEYGMLLSAQRSMRLCVENPEKIFGGKKSLPLLIPVSPLYPIAPTLNINKFIELHQYFFYHLPSIIIHTEYGVSDQRPIVSDIMKFIYRELKEDM